MFKSGALRVPSYIDSKSLKTDQLTCLKLDYPPKVDLQMLVLKPITIAVVTGVMA